MWFSCLFTFYSDEFVLVFPPKWSEVVMAIHSLQLAIIIVSAAALGFLLGAFTSTKWVSDCAQSLDIIGKFFYSVPFQVTGSQHKHPDGLRAGSIIKVHYGLFVGNTVSGADCNQTQRLYSELLFSVFLSQHLCFIHVSNIPQWRALQRRRSVCRAVSRLKRRGRGILCTCSTARTWMPPVMGRGWFG